MNWRHWLGLGLVVAAIAASIALYREYQRRQAQGAGTYQPDYILRDFTMVSLAQDGTQNLELTAPLLRRNDQTHAMDIDSPVFRFSDTQGHNWRAVSKTAWVSAKGEDVRLRGNAVVDSPDGTGTFTVQSEQLDITTIKGRERAKSAVEVRILQPGSIIRGRGMDADLAGNRVTLLADVKATYEPNH